MAEEAAASPPGGSEKTWGQKHHHIVSGEIAAINTRRDAEQLPKLSDPGHDKMIEATGLSLSGGGVRSAAICLGVLQALNHHQLLKRIDYLSTVSGGGYIGSSLTATMTRAKRFVFGNVPGSSVVPAQEISDTPAVGHIRNYSNYLIPAGFRDLLTGAAIVMRGLVANLSLTLPVVLLLAAITVISNPARSTLYAANFFGIHVGSENSCRQDYWLIDKFGFTPIFLALALLILAAREVSYGQSVRKSRNKGAASGGQGAGAMAQSRSELLAYVAGTILVLGLICDAARLLPVEHFGLTLAASLLGLLLFFAWALWRSRLPPNRLQEFRGLAPATSDAAKGSTLAEILSHLPTMGATYLVLLVAIFFFEFQPFMIAEMFDTADAASGQTLGLVGGVAVGWVKSLAAITAPIAAVVTLFRQQFADLLKGQGSASISAVVLAHTANIAVWLAGAALPLLIWIGYLYLCFWGVANDKLADVRVCPAAVEWPAAAKGEAAAKPDAGLAGQIQFDSGARKLTAEISSRPDEAQRAAKPAQSTPVSHTPGWLNSASGALSSTLHALGFGRVIVGIKHAFGEAVRWSMVGLYLLVGVLLFLLSWLLTPNANSLHRLYRDRLSKAFLFEPTVPAGKLATAEASIDQGRDFPPLDGMRLSGLAPRPAGAPNTNDRFPDKLCAPYHLINAALNIQGSDYANRRGRNADFFLFSPLHVGSEATGYAGTVALETAAPGLDLATAMAISGAAASSNMGSNSIRPLTPTLALLNIRLGYWLTNPRYVGASQAVMAERRATPTYLWSEISGRLYENSDAVYLTDGGHIENLGIYELLRRRCRLIICVDAEADAPMNFSSLMTLQRYARIDLGILIDLPWSPIRNATLGWMNTNAGKPPTPAADLSHGPHVAIGSIDYGGGESGYLVYIKSSLTGDENDYIRDYARRYDRFPHESTGDQFFSEEQFEVYRALGFHMVQGFLSGTDDVVVNVGTKRCVTAKFTEAGLPWIDDVRAALGLPPGTGKTV